MTLICKPIDFFGQINGSNLVNLVDKFLQVDPWVLEPLEASSSLFRASWPSPWLCLIPGALIPKTKTTNLNKYLTIQKLNWIMLSSSSNPFLEKWEMFLIVRTSFLIFFDINLPKLFIWQPNQVFCGKTSNPCYDQNQSMSVSATVWQSVITFHHDNHQGHRPHQERHHKTENFIPKHLLLENQFWNQKVYSRIDNQYNVNQELQSIKIVEW